MTRRRSRRMIAVEISANDDGTLSASWTTTIPRPPLPWFRRSLLCLLGRHRRVAVWDKDSGEPGWWPARWAVRCPRCGVRRP